MMGEGEKKKNGGERERERERERWRKERWGMRERWRGVGLGEDGQKEEDIALLKILEKKDENRYVQLREERRGQDG